MRYRVLVPKAPTGEVPRGAALLEARRGRGRVFTGREQFGELCARAARRGRWVALPEGCVEVGWYEAADGQLRTRKVAVLEEWLGRRVYREDFEALDNRMVRRGRARRLFLQGRYAEAQKIDPRMGL
jgi:hypothetical protein